MATKSSSVGKRAWSVDNLYVACEFARQGMNDSQIASLLNISHMTFMRWRKQHAAFKRAIEYGRKLSNPGDDVYEYVYKQLPEDLQDLWDDIHAVRNHQNGLRKMEALLQNKGDKARQHLFLYAFVKYGYRLTRAMKAVNISKPQYDRWVRTDPDFPALLDQIEFYQKQFYKDAMDKLVKEGNPLAVVHANRTRNRELFGDRVDVNVSGQVNHAHIHTFIPIEDLPLDIETRGRIADAIREKELNDKTLAIETQEDEEFDV